MGYIYVVKNKINGKMYIGQSIRKNIEDRWRQHKMCKKDTLGHYLYNSYIKYGINNFEHKLICICFDSDCNKYEEYYIKKFNTLYPNGYNLQPGGNNHKHTEDTKKILSEISLKRKTTKGTKLTEEHKEKIRKTLLKNKQNKINTKTPNTKKKISESLIKYYQDNTNISNGIKIQQYDKNNNLIKTFDSILSASNELKINRSVIERASSDDPKYSNYKTAKGFIWKRII